MEQAERKGEKYPRIRRGKVDSLNLYEITDYELEVLEKGSPSSIYLNLAILFLTIATSFFIALLTSQLTERTFIVFVIIVAVGYTVGSTLLILWQRNRESISDITKRIRSRISEEVEESSKTESES